MPAILPSLRISLLVIGAFACMAILQTFPLVQNLFDKTPAAFNSMVSIYVNAEQSQLFWSEHPLQFYRAFSPGVMAPMESPLLLCNTSLASTLVFGPIYLATGNLYFAINIFILLSLAGSAFSVFLLARYWLSNTRAAFVAGTIFSFTLPNLYLMVDVFFFNFVVAPLAVLFFDRFARDGKWRNILGTAACLVLLTYTNLYDLMLICSFLVVLTVLRWRSIFTHQNASSLACSIGLTLALIAPLVVGYVAAIGKYDLAEKVLIFCHSLFSVAPAEWLNVPQNNLLYSGWLAQEYTPFGFEFLGALFPGVSVVALVGIGVVRKTPLKVSPWLLLVMALFSMAAATGWVPFSFHKQYHANAALLYGLGKAIPFFAFFRMPYRFIHLASLTGAVLAGAGYLSIEQQIAKKLDRRYIVAMIAAAVVLINVESLSIPLPNFNYDNIMLPGPADRWLKESEFYGRSDVSILYLPSWTYARQSRWAVYPYKEYEESYTGLFKHLYHRIPVINGRLSFLPKGWTPRRAVMLPHQISQKYLKAIGVGLIVVQEGMLYGKYRQRFSEEEMLRAGLELLAAFNNGDRIYRIAVKTDMENDLYLVPQINEGRLTVHIFTPKHFSLKDQVPVEADPPVQMSAGVCNLKFWQDTEFSCGETGGRRSHMCMEGALVGGQCPKGWQRVKAKDTGVCCVDGDASSFWFNPKLCQKQQLTIELVDGAGRAHRKQIDYVLPLVVGGTTDEPPIEWDLAAEGLSGPFQIISLSVAEDYLKKPDGADYKWRLEQK